MRIAIEALTDKIRKTCEESEDNEQRVIERLTQRLHISRNINREYEETLTLGQRFADRIALFGGSWMFILLLLVLLFSWIALNTVMLVPFPKSFDPLHFSQSHSVHAGRFASARHSDVPKSLRC
jgi:uncharacterized membrane protein